MPDTTDAENQGADKTGGSPAKAPSSKVRSLAYRAFSTVCVLSILFLTFWFSNHWIYAILFSILAVGSLTEYFRMLPAGGFQRFRWPAFAATGVYLVFLFAPLWGYQAGWLSDLEGLALALLVTLVVLTRLRQPLEGRLTLEEIATTLFGFVYCVLLFSFVPKILMLPLTDTSGAPSSHHYIIYLLIVTKITDAGAYLVGSLIGRHKMIPHVSPGKTWQGFGGALLSAILGSLAACLLMGDRIPIITPVHAVVLAVALALIAVLGDLAESILKRSLNAKDSGRVMPGIGGFLDLVDSVIFTAPLFYLYLRIFG